MTLNIWEHEPMIFQKFFLTFSSQVRDNLLVLLKYIKASLTINTNL